MTEYIHSRNVVLVEYNTTQNWYAQIPNQNWLCVLISDNTARRYLDEVIAKIIAKDVCWISTVGKQCAMLHDLVDEEITFREVDIDKLYLPQHHIMTTWHTNFEEGIWFSIIAANADEIDIETVILLDMTHGKRRKDIEMAITKVKNG
ncbi:DUF7684 family protein [Runella zeae]|uniref:DUF7684 family protein n=1 Tax=Runella zeae TaxID=94255 RepID=UPI00048E947B|nr:hypothetical protein [Runella zeae]